MTESEGIFGVSDTEALLNDSTRRERGLLVAILFDAVFMIWRDMVMGLRCNAYYSEEDLEEAVRWVKDKSDGGSGLSFNKLCTLLGIDPEIARIKILDIDHARGNIRYLIPSERRSGITNLRY